MIYEVFVRSFRDSNGDGVGDIRGVVEALDYIRSVGADVIWLTPIFPSPSFHGYDVTDLYSVNPLYGDLDDLRKLVNEAHSRSMKIILDLPLHHTSVLHPWFSEKPDYYVWATSDDDLNERRPWDGGFVWHPLGEKHYRGYFGPCTADLDYGKSSVRREVRNIVDFWRNLGIDGFRIDAAKHFFRDHVENIRLLEEFGFGEESVSEVWDEPAVVELYSKVTKVFNFSVWGALKASIAERSPHHLYHALRSTSGFLRKSLHFLSSHDTNRIHSELGDRAALFALTVLTLLPGDIVVYYGDEIGMGGVYDPQHPENVSDPFPWCESLCCPQVALWKSPAHNRPFSGVSLERRGEFLEEFRKVLSIRMENPWIGEADIGGLEVDGSRLIYTVGGMKVEHDFAELKARWG